MHNAILRDEQTGEVLLLWAVLTETPSFTNEITGEPLDVGKRQYSSSAQILADGIHHEPFTLDVTLDLTGDPGEEAGSVGGAGYEIEQFNRLSDFINRTTSYSYVSYIFANQTAHTATMLPGLTIRGLGLTGFRAVKGLPAKAINVIGAQLSFQSFVFTQGGETISPDEFWDRGAAGLEELEDGEEVQIVAAAGIVGSLAGMLAAAAGVAFWPAVAIGVGAAVLVAGAGSFLGRLPVARGSLPYQGFTTEIDGKDYDFRLRANDDYDFVTLSMAYQGEYLVYEKRVTYGEDLLSGVVDSAVRNLHIIPLDPSGACSDVTPDNLGREVRLYAYKEEE